MHDRRINGAECLLRWNDSELGFISPGEFIPIAEESGLIAAIDHYVIDRTLEQMAAWQNAGQPCLPIAVNLSAHAFFDPGLVDFLGRRCRETSIAP